jgi:hypothetical protein
MTIEQFFTIFWIQTGLLAIAAILSLLRYKFRNLITRLMGFIFFAGCIANVSTWLFVQFELLRPFTNIPPVVYSIISICLYSWMYFNLTHKKKPAWYIVSASLFVCFAIANILFIQKISFANSYTYLFHSFLVIVYCLLYFYTLMQELPSLYVHRLPTFWFSAGLLFYYAGAFFLFSFTSYIVNVLNNNLISYWGFHNLLSILAHLIILVGLYYDLRMLKSKENPVD